MLERSVRRGQMLAPHVRPETALVSLMHVNNETGTLYPVNKLAEKIKLHSPNCFVHSDMVQSLGKVDVSWLGGSKVDFDFFRSQDRWAAGDWLPLHGD